MNTGKSEFRLTFNAAPEEINRVIQQYLSANGFVIQQEGNANYYVSNRGLSQKRFEYYINGNQLLILAYMGTFENPQKLEGVVGAVPKQMYQNQILQLMQELEKVGQVQQESILYGDNNYMNTTSKNVFLQENNKKNETWAIVGFIISIIGLLLSCLGTALGATIIFLEFWCAYMGLKTKKRGLSIATIIIAIISLLILMLQLIIRFMGAL